MRGYRNLSCIILTETCSTLYIVTDFYPFLRSWLHDSRELREKGNEYNVSVFAALQTWLSGVTSV